MDFGDGFEPWPTVHYVEDPVTEVLGSMGVQELDVTSTIQKYSDGEENRGWIVVPTGSGGVDAVSSEGVSGGGPPRLTVTIEGEAGISDFALY